MIPRSAACAQEASLPSVYVSWNGRCPISARLAVGERIQEVGKLADALFDQSSCKWYGWRLEGEGLAEEELFPAEWVEPVGDGLVRVSHVHLFGAEFRLADPRDLYPGEDRVSFVFARLLDQGQPPAARPEDSGVVVLFEDATECDRFRGPLIQNARFFLRRPSIHLRYFGEAWMDQLLAFIRHFHMPELHYWRHTELPGADRFAHIEASDTTRRDEAWEQVKDALVREAAEWVPKGRELRAMHEHVLRAGTVPSWWLAKPYAPLALELTVVAESEDAKQELLSLLMPAQADFEVAARNAIFGAGKGLDLHHVPLRFGETNLSLKTSLGVAGDKLHVDVRLATPDLPDHAIAMAEAGASGEAAAGRAQAPTPPYSAKPEEN
jgi:hypothetical protein